MIGDDPENGANANAPSEQNPLVSTPTVTAAASAADPSKPLVTEPSPTQPNPMQSMKEIINLTRDIVENTKLKTASSRQFELDRMKNSPSC